MDSLKKLLFNKNNILKIILYSTVVFFVFILMHYKEIDDFSKILFYFFIVYCISSFFKIEEIDSSFQSLLLRLSISVYILSYGLWILSIFGINIDQMVYFISFLIIFLFLKFKINTVKKDFESIKNTFAENGLLLNFIFVIFFLFFIIIASYPVIVHDAVVKHIPIVYQIINRGVLEYNVVQSLVLGESSLLPHMNYLFLMVIGVEKLKLFNVFISFISLFILLEIAKFISKDKIYLILISICYLSFPLLFVLSTTLMIDIFLLLFILSLVLLLNSYLVNRKTSMNLIVSIILLFFAAYFSKQTSLCALVPLFLFCLMPILNYPIKKIFFLNWIFLTLLILTNILPYLYIYLKTGNPIFPFLNQIFKSDYFLKEAFLDSRWLEIGNLFDIIFNSSKYIEAENGVLGLYLLLILLLPIILFFYKKNKTVLFILFIAICSYILNIYTTKGHLRYMLNSFILLMPILFLIYPILKNIKSFLIKFIIIFTLAVPNTLFSVYFNVNKYNLNTKPEKDYLSPHEGITQTQNGGILKQINDKNIYLLSNEPYSGTFKGRWFSLDLYGTFYQKLLIDNIISVDDFFSTFDYFLYNKEINFSLFKKNELFKKGLITKVDENEKYILYKFKQNNYKSILKFNSKPYKKINISKPLVFNFIHTKEAEKYKINLDLDISNVEVDTYSRFQINWTDENGKFIGTSLIPFKLEKFRNQYSHIINANEIPKNAKNGYLYITGHNNEDNIIFYKVELCYKNKSTIKIIMDNYLKEIISYNILQNIGK